MHRRPHLIVALTLAVAALASATAGVRWWQARPVQVTVPAAGANPACTDLATRLPARVHGAPRVPTSTGSPAVAAWADPAIIWRCGVPQPGPTADCLEVDGVDWVFRRLDDGTAFTSYGRDPAVQVLVPDAYAPEPLLLPPLSAVVARLPQGPHRCS